MNTAIDHTEALDGPERGVRTALLRNGADLEVTVLLDRGFDLGEARVHGYNPTWRSTVGAVHPHAYQQESGWLRRFAGGLMTTCGLDNVDPASEGRPLHGRYSNLPGTLLAKRSFWQGERYLLELIGEVRNYALFGPHLILTHRLVVEHDSNNIQNLRVVEDVVENQGFTPQPLMPLYYCNFGYPFLTVGAWLLFESEGYCEVAIENPALALRVCLRFAKAALLYFTLLKQLGQGAYVLGLKPSTCGVLGYAAERARGRARRLKPGERYETRFKFHFIQERNRR